MDGERYYKGSRMSVTNIMAKIVCAPFDLPALASISNAIYHKGKYTRVSFKLTQCHCNVYARGTVVLMGGKSMDGVNLAVEELSGKLEEHFFPIDIKPKILNVATSFALKSSRVGLDQFYLKHRDDVFNCVYEPELSNGIHFSFDPFSRVILHQTGKGIITGLQSLHEGYCVLMQLHNMLCQ